MLKILNFTTTIAMPMKLSKDLYFIEVFNLLKPCGITHWVWEGINKATLWCIILHGITGQNFKQNWIRFRESWPKNYQKHPKMKVSAGTKTLKIYNSTTRDPISLKADSYVYHLNTFHLLKTEWVNQREGTAKKTIKKYQEFINILTLILLENSLENVIRLRTFPLSSIVYLKQTHRECGRKGGALHLPILPL